MKTSGIFFAIVIIAFLLPFMVVKCGEQDIASISGFKMVTGGKVELKDMEDVTQGLTRAMENVAPDEAAEMEATETKETETRSMKPSFLAIIALLAAIAGLITALIMDKRSSILPLALAIIGFLALLFVKGSVSKQVIGSAGGEIAGMIAVKTQFGYYLALLSFLAAGITAYLAGRKTPLLSREQISDFIPDKMENAYDKARDSVTQAGAGVAGTVGGAYDKFKDKIEEADLEDKFHATVDKVKDKLDNANLDDKFRGAVDKAKDRFDDAVDSVKDRIDNADKKSDEMADKAKEKIDNADKKSDEMADEAREKIDNADKKSDEMAEEARKRIDNTEKKLDEIADEAKEKIDATVNKVKDAVDPPERR